MFKRILIANRGEIACRIIKTAKSMAIETVAVYSEADRSSLHVKQADFAEFIGPAPASESYLDIDAIIGAAKKWQADAIHPGYGFLSENPKLAKACSENGIVFIGPSTSAIEAMGSKSQAKAIMSEANVPLVPGYHGTDNSVEHLLAEAEKIGYPVMLKATQGGGGKGMRVVNSAAEMPLAIDGAQREALSSFGDKQLLIVSDSRMRIFQSGILSGAFRRRWPAIQSVRFVLAGYLPSKIAALLGEQTVQAE